MRNTRTLALAMALTVAFLAAFAANLQAGPPNGNINAAKIYRAKLKGSEEVPPVATDARGVFILRALPHRNSLKYTLITVGLQDITAAHIHLAPAGVNGPVVAFLFDSAGTPVTKNGFLSRGTITDADLLGPLTGMTIADLRAAIDAGNAYVNVHTLAHPPGEIRGQID